jgi:hypothetical protein
LQLLTREAAANGERAAMRKNEERKRHDRLSPDGFYQPVGSGSAFLLPLKTIYP